MLDILSKRGQQTVADLNVMVAMWHRHNPGWMYIKTPEDSDSPIDAVLVDQEGVIRGAVETKCRYGITFDGFKGTFKNEWLITMSKVIAAADVAKGLRVPLVGFLYLVLDGTLLVQRITDSSGNFTAAFRCETTQTQATCNGGVAVRANAYINMSQSKKHRDELSTQV